VIEARRSRGWPFNRISAGVPIWYPTHTSDLAPTLNLSKGLGEVLIMKASRITSDRHIQRARLELALKFTLQGTTMARWNDNRCRTIPEIVPIELQRSNFWGASAQQNPDVLHAPLIQPMLSTKFGIRDSYPS
jgi:hypothetical protein